MILSKKDSRYINLAIIGTSVLVWILLLFNPGHIMTLEHCHVSDAGPSAASLQMLLEMNPVSSQLIGWELMVIAMMLPKLIIPIRHIYRCSLKRYRFPLALMFVLGYIGVWTIVGIGMIAIIMAAHLLMPGSFLPAFILGVIAIIWQFSPIKQRFLNRGHEHWRLAVFGWPAFKNALLFGIMHGVWCVGAGWALMLFPMLLPEGHNLAMILVTFIMISEHMERPQVPRWRFDFRVKLLKMIVYQAQMKWKRIT